MFNRAERHYGNTASSTRRQQRALTLPYSFLQKVCLKIKLGYQWCTEHSTARLRSVCERVRRGTWWQRRTGSTCRRCQWRRRCSPPPCAPPSSSGPRSPGTPHEAFRRQRVHNGAILPRRHPHLADDEEYDGHGGAEQRDQHEELEPEN